MKATRSCFSAFVSFVPRTTLKNSTVSSSVSRRPSCRYGGVSLIPRSGNVLILPSVHGHVVLDHLRLEEAAGLQIVHLIVRVVRRRVAGRALALAVEHRLAAQLCLRGLRRIELAEHVECGRGREIQDVLELRHEMHLAAALQDVDALLRRDHRVAVEVRGALLELGEVLDGLQRALRAEQPLDVHAAQRGRLDAMTEFLRADVAHEVRRAVRVAVGVTIEARDALARLHRTAVAGRVELLLRERREQQAQSFELLRIQDAAEQLVVVRQRHELALGDVAEIRPRRQEDRGRALREQMLRRQEIEIEAREVAPLLRFHQVDVRLREQHPALGMVRMRQRHEARGLCVAFLDLGGGHRAERLPRDARRQLHAHAGLHGLAARHLHGRRRFVRRGRSALRAACDAPPRRSSFCADILRIVSVERRAVDDMQRRRWAARRRSQHPQPATKDASKPDAQGRSMAHDCTPRGPCESRTGRISLRSAQKNARLIF